LVLVFYGLAGTVSMEVIHMLQAQMLALLFSTPTSVLPSAQSSGWLVTLSTSDDRQLLVVSKA
jgi:hypothetical protein